MKLFNEKLTQEQQETLLWMIKSLNRNTFAPHLLYKGNYNCLEDELTDSTNTMNYIPYVLMLFGQLGNKDYEFLMIEEINKVIEQIKTNEEYKKEFFNLKKFALWGIADEATEDYFNPDLIEEGDEENVKQFIKKLKHKKTIEKSKRENTQKEIQNLIDSETDIKKTKILKINNKKLSEKALINLNLKIAKKNILSLCREAKRTRGKKFTEKEVYLHFKRKVEIAQRSRDAILRIETLIDKNKNTEKEIMKKLIIEPRSIACRHVNNNEDRLEVARKGEESRKDYIFMAESNIESSMRLLKMLKELQLVVKTLL